MGILDDVFAQMPNEPDRTGGGNSAALTGAPKQSTRDLLSATRMIYLDGIRAGMTFLSPHPCNGANCGLPATTHTAGKYHECAVTDQRAEGPAVVVLYMDEDGIPQSVGPLPGIMPIRIKLTFGEIGSMTGD